jgi:hypothetical protein
MEESLMYIIKWKKQIWKCYILCQICDILGKTKLGIEWQDQWLQGRGREDF